MKYPSLKNLACISGFNTIGESQPHGTNHAGAAALAAIVAADTFDTVDLFAEVAPKAGLLGGEACGITFPTAERTKVRLLESSELYYTNTEYSLILSLGGGLMQEKNQFYHRPTDGVTPLVSEIDCSHGRQQWINIFLGASFNQLKRGDGFIFKSHATKRLFETIWGEWRQDGRILSKFPSSCVSPNPVNPEKNRRSEQLRILVRSKLGLAESDIVFLMFSRIEPQTKGDLISMLQVWRQLLSENPNVKLLVSGLARDGHYVNEVRTAVREAGIGNSVVILPNPYEWIVSARNALMSASDAFVHISTGIEESAPLTILEAMAHELPCIGASWSGIPEQIVHGQTGFVIPVIYSEASSSFEAGFWGQDWLTSNIEACQLTALNRGVLLDSLRILSLDCGRRHEMGRRAREFVVSSRSIANATSERLGFFEEVVSSSKERERVSCISLARGLVKINSIIPTLAFAGKALDGAQLVKGGNGNARLNYFMNERFITAASEVLEFLNGGKKQYGRLNCFSGMMLQ